MVEAIGGRLAYQHMRYALAVVFSIVCSCQSLAEKPRPPRVPTTLNPVSRSLSALLDDGWTIASSGGPLGFVLHKENKWIVCGVDDGSLSVRGATSQCVSLN